MTNNNKQSIRPDNSILATMALSCLEDSKAWFPEVATSVEHHALSLAGEVGEFCNIVKKIQRGSLNPADAHVHYELSMELTDVFIYVLNLAGLLRVDLEHAYHVKRQENVVRFNKANADGDSLGGTLA